jgi:hypothetical protein
MSSLMFAETPEGLLSIEARHAEAVHLHKAHPTRT